MNTIFSIYVLLTRKKIFSLPDYFEKEYKIKISRMSPNKIFMFLITPPSGNAKIQKTNSKTCIRML